ncbi:hypothetical protein [Falsihalocynthiibacter arcticus]|uniref:Uncharacterized protein n=1 Tax=Falsihalocynthiibacter arcticus TaxID=1579316 RepID=A0A126V1Z4_9RHOB|nr:hypothetical protein [Falsihalocynthiibacter arcticus]AML52342.1 hypothetical protein RC74_14615 [Falsihalocynthiibacter arcticus]
MRAPRPDAELLAPCEKPRLAPGAKSQADIEIALGRIGSDLITCADRHGALANWTIEHTAIVGFQ